MPLHLFKTLPQGLCTTGSLVALLVAATPAVHAQIVNGDFSAGNTGFSTDYTLVANDHTVFTGPLQYAVISNPNTAFTNGYSSFGDHTTGTGLMLFADGSGNANDRIWYQTVTVTPNTTYTLSAWAATAGASNPPTLNFYSDTNLLGNLAVGSTPGAFQQFSVNFTTGNVTSTVLAIRDGNTVGSGNDFVIDDIRLVNPNATATPEPGSMALLAGMGLAGAGFFTRRRKQAKKIN